MSKEPKRSAFVQKLYTMLSDPNLNNLIWWTKRDDGTFALLPGAEFAYALTGYFKHGNVASFVRQLHMYGFHKVCDSEQNDSTIWEFKHSSGKFREGDEASLAYIKRRSSANVKNETQQPVAYEPVYYIPQHQQHQHQQHQQPPQPQPPQPPMVEPYNLFPRHSFDAYELAHTVDRDSQVLAHGQAQLRQNSDSLLLGIQKQNGQLLRYADTVPELLDNQRHQHFQQMYHNPIDEKLASLKTDASFKFNESVSIRQRLPSMFLDPLAPDPARSVPPPHAHPYPVSPVVYPTSYGIPPPQPPPQQHVPHPMKTTHIPSQFHPQIRPSLIEIHKQNPEPTSSISSVKSQQDSIFSKSGSIASRSSIFDLLNDEHRDAEKRKLEKEDDDAVANDEKKQKV